MLELFSSETSIVLGLDLSDEEDKLIKTAVSLSRKTGARLILVHAILPLRSYAGVGEDLALPFESIEEETQVKVFQDVEHKLQALRDRLPPELLIDIEVVRDYPENALESVAEKTHASLIMAGMRPRGEQSVWYSGMSTALSLMGSSQFPVMILPLSTEIDFGTREHTVLVADNLKEEGLIALKAALGLCRSVPYKQLIHLHVRPASYRDLNETAEKIKLAMIEGRIPSNPEFETGVYLKQLKQEAKEVMHERLSLADLEFAKGLHWSPRVRFGQAVDELHQAVKETKADILIFGKHHFLRPKGLVLGKIPYEAMVEDHVASIVVPSEERETRAEIIFEKYRAPLEDQLPGLHN